MKAFRQNNYVKVIFDDDTSVEKEFATTEEAIDAWNFVAVKPGEDLRTESEIKKYFLGEDPDMGKHLLENVDNSNILVRRGASVYMIDVSELSIPQDFVEKIIEAEKDNDYDTLQKYINFWKLVSLNPDSRVRDNLFWFIRKWDMQITDSGMIKAYRNATLKHESRYSTKFVKDVINKYYITKYIDKIPPQDVTIEVSDGGITNLDKLYNDVINKTDDAPVYTDLHSHSTNIVLGHPVRIPREDCDANQEHSCSRGLHVGAKGWLKQNYYGDVGLMVLVNPANVVAVPTIDEYGKMRTCEYFPIGIVDFDENGDVIEPEYDIHSDIEYLKQIQYDGDVNNDDINNYVIKNTYVDREELYASIIDSITDFQDLDY